MGFLFSHSQLFTIPGFKCYVLLVIFYWLQKNLVHNALPTKVMYWAALWQNSVMSVMPKEFLFL